MRPVLSAVVVALVLLTATFLMVVPTSGFGSHAVAHPSSGVRTAAAPNYYVSVQLTTNPVLPGYSDTLLFSVLNDTNHAPVQTLSSITIVGNYYDTGLVAHTLPGTPAPQPAGTPIGSWTFQVPSTATADVFYPPTLTVWANTSSPSMNASGTTSVEVGTLIFSSASVCGVFSCGSLTTGQPGAVTTSVEIETGFGARGPAAGETVKVSYFSTGSSPVSVPGVPATLTTDYNGFAGETFTPNSTIFNVPGPNHVEIQVTDSVNTSLSIFINVSWNLYNPVGTADFAFWLNSLQYYSGGSVTANWQYRGTNSSVGPITVTNYVVTNLFNPRNVIASGLVGSTSATGSFQFTLPSTYYGVFQVVAYAHNSTDFWVLGATAVAYLGLFTANPSEYYYNPGDTITVSVTEQGAEFNGATVTALVEAVDSGQTLFNGTVSGGSFQFTIPSVAPAPGYAVGVWATSSTHGLLASSGGDVFEASGFDFWAGITSASSYADGSYMPGQTVQVGYKVTAYGLTTLPSTMLIAIYPGNCGIVCFANTPALKTWIVTSASGSVAFTLPNGLPNGVETFNVEAIALVGGLVGTGQVAVNVNSSPSALNYELGAGSGLTVGWLILLILIVIIAFVIIMSRRRGRPSKMVMTPAPSSTPPAAEWKESTPSSGAGGSSGGAGSPPPGAQ